MHGILDRARRQALLHRRRSGRARTCRSSDGKGRKWTSNNTDCRAGTIWRCDLDGTNLELIAHNFRNEYEPCVDSFGTIFVSDNDDDGNQQTRICYVMPGGNYGYWPRGPGESHWHEEQPGVVPKILRTGFGSPTGMCVYEGTLLPKKYQGQLLHTDAGPRHASRLHLKPQGRRLRMPSARTWSTAPTTGSARRTSASRRTAASSSPTGTTPASAATAWAIDQGADLSAGAEGEQVCGAEGGVGEQGGLLATLGSPCLAVRSMAIEKFRMDAANTANWSLAA